MPQETIIIERNDCEGGWVERAMQEKKTDNFNIANNFQIKKRFTNTEETCGGEKNWNK